MLNLLFCFTGKIKRENKNTKWPSPCSGCKVSVLGMMNDKRDTLPRRLLYYTIPPAGVSIPHLALCHNYIGLGLGYCCDSTFGSSQVYSKIKIKKLGAKTSVTVSPTVKSVGDEPEQGWQFNKTQGTGRLLELVWEGNMLWLRPETAIQTAAPKIGPCCITVSVVGYKYVCIHVGNCTCTWTVELMYLKINIILWNWSLKIKMNHYAHAGIVGFTYCPRLLCSLIVFVFEVLIYQTYVEFKWVASWTVHDGNVCCAV